MGELLREGIVNYAQWNFHRPEESLDIAFGPELAAKVPDVMDPRVQVWIAVEIGSTLDNVLTDFVERCGEASCIMIGGVAYYFTMNNAQKLSADEFRATGIPYSRAIVAQVWIFMPLGGGRSQTSDGLIADYINEGRFLNLDPYLPTEPEESDVS